jgi:peptide-methionine (S)-S-oxide reductase
METIVLGGGCFWCLEATYQLVRGIESVVPGYAGGSSKNPNYWSVHDGDADHAEVVKIEFDEDFISLSEILDIFWIIHDPTTKDRQGHDIGPEYRSIILYNSDKQRDVIDNSLQIAQKFWDDPIVTEVKELDQFYEAEAEHHNYFQNHPEQAYCQIVINPKLQKLRQKFADRLK